jgi:hypothetical protein
MLDGNAELAKRVLKGREVDVLVRDGEAKMLFKV